MKVSAITMPVRRRLGVRLPAREQLLAMFPKGSVGAEIGVWRGRFSADILAVVRPKTLHLIDPWEFMADKGDSIYGGMIAEQQADMDAIYNAVMQRFARQVSAGTVVVHRALSAAAATKIDDGSLDWIYIDGDHSYEGTRTDLESFAPKMRAGGLITGDDYRRSGMAAGVRKAVDEFIAAGSATLEWQRDQQYALRIPS
jgi:hypothetical protein